MGSVVLKRCGGGALERQHELHIATAGGGLTGRKSGGRIIPLLLLLCLQGFSVPREHCYGQKAITRHT